MNTLEEMPEPAAKLPVGVVLPTYNCRAHLSAHLAAVREWAGLVEEIIVVDSFSDDGTMELLKEQLSQPNVRFHHHPRGLYQSWNFGISQISAKYIYISTVGDLITGDGLRHLVAVAEQFQADATLSPPHFVASDGRSLVDSRWPIQDLIQWHDINCPTAISSIHAFLMSVLPMPQGILGSSASNLYRTDLLRKRPFPTSFDPAGDSAWSLQYALGTRFAVTPTAVSQFLVHPKDTKADPEQEERLFGSLFDLALTAVRSSDPGGLLPFLENLRAKIVELQRCERLYTWWRNRLIPWIFRPPAWYRRALRNRRRTQLQQLRAEIMAKFGLHPRTPQS